MTDPKYMRPGLGFAMGKAIEEAGEFLAAIGKTQRWGWMSTNPELPVEQRETNADWVRREMADLRGALDHLEHEMTLGHIPRGVIGGHHNLGSDDGGNVRSSVSGGNTT